MITSQGCDLLSFYYLCRTGNNRPLPRLATARVVICFHFTIFVVLETTGVVIYFHLSWLWFAFILLSLSYWKQHSGRIIGRHPGCDLLSFYYLCRTGNNDTIRRTILTIVVICFHFTIFVVLETTTQKSYQTYQCCDLLSFYYLCRTGNNRWTYNPASSKVVICFHFTIFVVLETTQSVLFVVCQCIIEIAGI